MNKKRWIRAGQITAALVVVALTTVFVSGASTSTNFALYDATAPGAARCDPTATLAPWAASSWAIASP